MHTIWDNLQDNSSQRGRRVPSNGKQGCVCVAERTHSEARVRVHGLDDLHALSGQKTTCRRLARLNKPSPLPDVSLGRGTDSLVHLIEDHPVGVDLGVSLWVQHHGLVGPEVGQRDLGVLRAVVDDVNDAVFVKVPFARVSNSVGLKQNKKNSPPSQTS